MSWLAAFQRGAKSFPRLALIPRSGLTNKYFANCHRVFSRVLDALSCTGFHELLTFRLGTKQETGIIAAFLPFDLVRSGLGAWENRRTEIFNCSFVLAAREIDQNCTPLKFLTLLVS